jgi:hypothetical protein
MVLQLQIRTTFNLMGTTGQKNVNFFISGIITFVYSECHFLPAEHQYRSPQKPSNAYIIYIYPFFGLKLTSVNILLHSSCQLDKLTTTHK